MDDGELDVEVPTLSEKVAARLTADQDLSQNKAAAAATIERAKNLRVAIEEVLDLRADETGMPKDLLRKSLELSDFAAMCGEGVSEDKIANWLVARFARAELKAIGDITFDGE